jgi:hypothetical protein
MTALNLTLPVGRVVQGSLYTANDKDFDGNPLVVKRGPNAGKPTVQYFFAIAIPKGPERSWFETPWGQEILKVGAAAFPSQYQHPDFSWKIADGDSAVPNKRGGKNADKEGFPGHWIVKLSSGFAPKTFRSADGGKSWQPIVEPDFIKCGYFVQVNVTVDGNGQSGNPGVYLNHNLVAFNNFGPEIVQGPDPGAVGFAAPVAAANAAPPAMPMPSAPAAPAVPAAPAIPVTPNPGILNVPAVPGVPAVAPPPPAAPVHRMTPKAAGASYEALIGAGWNDALLVQHGMMEA